MHFIRTFLDGPSPLIYWGSFFGNISIVIICQYKYIFANSAEELTCYRLKSNTTQTEQENIFCLSWDLNPDLSDKDEGISQPCHAAAHLTLISLPTTKNFVNIMNYWTAKLEW